MAVLLVVVHVDGACGQLYVTITTRPVVTGQASQAMSFDHLYEYTNIK